jgi:hypothetical protein
VAQAGIERVHCLDNAPQVSGLDGELTHAADVPPPEVGGEPGRRGLLCASSASLIRLNEDEFGLKLSGYGDSHAARQLFSNSFHGVSRGE